MRFCADSIFTRLLSAGHIRTISAATSKTMEACCRSDAHPYTSARSSPSPQHNRRATAAASSLFPFFGNFNVCRVELTVSIGLDYAKQIPDDFLLPAEKLELLTGPDALRMRKAINEADRIIGLRLVIMRCFGHEWRYLMFHSHHLLMQKNHALILPISAPIGRRSIRFL